MSINMPSFPGGVTVLMAVYHKDDPVLFERAIRSVYENTLLPDAFILVVDGPVGPVLGKLISSLQESYGFEVVNLSRNLGLARALNEGLKKIRTTWVARADADDYNHPRRFELQAAAICRHSFSLSIIGGAIREVDRHGVVLARRFTAESHEEIVKYAVKRNPFNHMTVIFRTESALKCGGYPDIHLKEDYGLWASMLGMGFEAANIQDILVDATTGREMYRRRGGFGYALAEYTLQKHLVKTGIKRWPRAIIDAASRGMVFVMPSAIRSQVYMRYLRSKVQD